ncbi:MAG: SGNH/GDSL hydrolase family protein [Bryobacteraceae bacterium]
MCLSPVLHRLDCGCGCRTIYSYFGDSLMDTARRNFFSANQKSLAQFPSTPGTMLKAGLQTGLSGLRQWRRVRPPERCDTRWNAMGVFGQVGGPGNNYAIGGARTDDGGALGLLDIILPTGMFQQVDFYLSRNSGVADPDGLYSMFGGGNDLRDAARIADPIQRQLAAVQAGANIAYSVRDLYLAGARQFVLINSPDGLIPETIGDGISLLAPMIQFNTWFGLWRLPAVLVPGFLPIF